MRIFSLVRKQNAPHFWGAAIGAGASLLGTLLSNRAIKDTAGAGILSLDEQKQLFDYQQNRLENLQNSAHQREVEDLRKSGLNPILSSGGQGAASGLGATIDANAYNSARSAANDQIVKGKLGLVNGLVTTAGQLMNFQNAYEQADAAKTTADANMTNANTAAGRLKFDIVKYYGSEMKKDLSAAGLSDAQAQDVMSKMGPMIENLKSQTLLNKSSAGAINEKLPVEIWKMKQDSLNNPTKVLMDILRPVFEDIQKSGQSSAEKEMINNLKKVFSN